MIKIVDTSYYIINNKEKKELFIYYDTEHKLDCNMNIFDFQFDFNLKDIDNDNKDEIIEYGKISTIWRFNVYWYFI